MAFEREKMANLARGVVGWSAGGATRDQFCDLIAHGETPAVMADMATLSTCGLTVRGLWRVFGMSDPRLEAPYAPGSVITNLVAMAKEAGAWSEQWERRCEVGDMIYVSNPDHVGTVIEAKDGAADGSWSIVTVDGGTTDAAGNQAIARYERAVGDGGLLLSGPLSGNGRKVYGVAHLPALAARFGGGSVFDIGAPGGAFGVGDAAAIGAVGLGAWLAWRVLRRS